MNCDAILKLLLFKLTSRVGVTYLTSLIGPHYATFCFIYWLILLRITNITSQRLLTVSLILNIILWSSLRHRPHAKAKRRLKILETCSFLNRSKLKNIIKLIIVLTKLFTISQFELGTNIQTNITKFIRIMFL